MKRFILISITVVLLSGCVSAPAVDDYIQQPTDGWQEQQISPASSQSSVDLTWWNQFDDVALNTMIQMAWDGNPDLAIAQARLREASAQRTQARALLWPSVNATADYTWSEQSINSPGGPSSLISAGFIDRDLEFWGADLNARWDLDLFGANRFRNQSAAARLAATEASTRGAVLAVLSEVVTAYVDYRGLQERIDLVNRNIKLQAAAVDIINKRSAAGLESGLNVRRAAGQLASTRAAVPRLIAAQRSSLWRLTVLLDADIHEIETLLGAASVATVDVQMVDVGMRSEILLRRPDVAIAEFMMRAAASDVGAARADLFPKLVLSASAGYESGATSSLFDSASRVLGVAPQLSVPVFQRGRLKAERSAAIARFEMTYAEYRKTVLQAIAEAESWLVSLATEQQSHDEYARAFEETDKAAELAGKLYDRGLINYLELLDAQREVLQSEDAWVQSRIRKQLAFVNLYIALGGGWQQYPGR